MAKAGQIFAFNSQGSLRASPEEVVRTPTVIAILMVIFTVFLLICVGIGIYFHKIEEEKRLHPNTPGKGKWYLTKTGKVIIVGLGILGLLLLVILALVVIFVVPGPMLAEARERDKSRSDTDKYANKLFSSDLNDL